MTKNDTKKPSVLVLLSTGKMGSGIVDAFVASGMYKVYGTSRNSQHAGLLAKGVTPVPFRFGDMNSIQKALQVSQADTVVIITHLMFAKGKAREAEVLQGTIVMDACKEARTPHVILTSTNLSEGPPEGANHLKSKLELEKYIKAPILGLPCYSILRPSSFFENYDDPSVMNPLCRGYLKDLYEGHVPIPHVATLDIGKAAVVMTNDRDKWSSKTLTCVVSTDTGDELAKILSQVSGVPCVYRFTPPRFILRYVLPKDLYHMVEFVTTNRKDWSKEIREFKAAVPDALNFQEWLIQQKGEWSDGTKFNEPPLQSSFFKSLNLVYLGIFGVTAAVAARIYIAW